MKFIILLYIFLVISVTLYKEHMICLISYRKFSDVLPAFTYASAIGYPWSTCLGVLIFWDVLHELIYI